MRDTGSVTGTNDQFNVEFVTALKRTETGTAAMFIVCGAISARCVVPPYPVT
jgi:hypothetical protein